MTDVMMGHTDPRGLVFFFPILPFFPFLSAFCSLPPTILFFFPSKKFFIKIVSAHT